MERHLITKSLVTLSLLLACTQLVHGFATTNCEHDQLVTQIKELLKCHQKNEDKFIDESEDIIKELIQNDQNSNFDDDLCPLVQKFARKEILCVNSLAETCFEQKIAGLVSEASSVFEGDCDTGPRGSGPINQKNLQTFMNKVESTIGRSPASINYVVSKITFDKQCSLEERMNAFYKGSIECVMKKYGNYGNNGRNDIQNSGPPSPIPKCNTIMEMLTSCSNSNDCFSQQEMDLVRDTVFTIYQMTMEKAAKLMKKFDGIGDSQEQLEWVKAAVKDFETGNCKTKIKSSPAALLSSAPNQLLSKFLAIMLSVVCVMFI